MTNEISDYDEKFVWGNRWQIKMDSALFLFKIIARSSKYHKLQ